MMSLMERIKSNCVQNVQIDLFSENIVDKDVQAMLLPLTSMQTILLCPKFRIKNEFIIPIDVLYKVIVICGAVLATAEHIFRITHNFDNDAHEYTFLKIQDLGTYTDFIFNFSGFLVNFSCNLIQSKNNVLFILTCQEVHRFVSNDVHFKRFVRRNWLCVAMLFGSFTLFTIYNYVLYPNLPFYVIFGMVVLIVFDAEMIYAIRLMKLLEDNVVHWNHRIVTSINNHQNETCPNRLFEVYLHILKSYNIYKNIFQQVVGLVTYIFFFYFPDQISITVSNLNEDKPGEGIKLQYISMCRNTGALPLPLLS